LIVIRDLSQYTPVMSSTGFMDYQDRGVRSLATVGLRSGSHLLGLLNFGAEEALPETGRQNENFQAIASQVAIAIENRNLLQSARRQAEQMQRTVTFGQAIQASLEPATIYETLLRESANLIDFDDLHIMIFDHEKGELQIVARNDGVQMSTLLESDLAVGTEGTTAGHVWENQTLLHLTDLMQETELQHPYRKDIHALMAAPFRSRGMMRGVIEVGSTIQNTYSDTDVAVFQHMVSQLAVALENAEAYAQSQQLAKNKALAGEISSQLQQQTDINSILNIAVSELGTVLGARRGRIRLGIHAPDRTDP
jgi:GAF domain-containing protein